MKMQVKEIVKYKGRNSCNTQPIFRVLMFYIMMLKVYSILLVSGSFFFFPSVT